MTTHRKSLTLIAASTAAFLAGSAFADVFDVQTANDNQAATTLNELVHGSDQWHDLKALPGPKADSDWYRISQRPYSSYEIVVEGLSGDVPGPGFQLARVAGDGTTVLQIASSIGLGAAKSLRFVNDSADVVNDQFIVVRRAFCAKTCGADDVYRIRAAETTAAISRFNNTGSQVTVLILQNPTDEAVTGTIRLWTAQGTSAGSLPLNIPARGSQVVSSQLVAPGLSGNVTIVHSAPYGDLVGKAVGLEPATGFSFDTAMEHRPR